MDKMKLNATAEEALALLGEELPNEDSAVVEAIAMTNAEGVGYDACDISRVDHRADAGEIRVAATIHLEGQNREDRAILGSSFSVPVEVVLRRDKGGAWARESYRITGPVSKR